MILFFLIENNVVASLGLSWKSVNEVENAYQGFLRVIYFCIFYLFTKKSLNEDYEERSERNFI